MSIHHLECAARTRLPASTKLVLMAFCDDADKVSRIAFPGIAAAMEWSGLSKSRVLTVIAELVEIGYLARLSAGHKGHRAEFRVFDRVGCCALHGPANVTEFGSGRPDPVEDDKGYRRQYPKDVGKGSGQQHPMDDKGSREQDPKPQKGSVQQYPIEPKGSYKGSCSYRTPPVSPVTTTNSLRELARTAKSDTTRGHRLPDDWQPTRSDVTWTREQGYTDDWARRTTEQFCDYWHAESGAKATKRDWSKAWKVWLRRDADRRPAQRTPSRPAGNPYLNDLRAQHASYADGSAALELET